ncbi:MAG TPA: pyruvate kinase [Firmicutes bacterium]|nr:pyruvate kinase [Bacillota bacterium]
MLNISKKTKIVATIGPASDTYEMLLSLLKAGMNVMRLNFSHGDYAGHLAKIELARRLEKDTGIYIPVMLDTRGPEIRLGLLENDAIDIPKGHTLTISMEPVLGNLERISVTYSGLFDDVKLGDHLKIDDGNLDFEIIKKNHQTRELLVIALNAHRLKSRKGVNAPFARLSMPFISKKDEEDLAFGVAHKVDYIAASFTRRPQDVIDIKETIKRLGGQPIPIIAKIENPEGVENLEAILGVADGIMVARGDLGVEIPAERVPIVQKHIVAMCRRVGKPVITATQMLDSMQTHPRPTRAEVSDVANAIIESTDAIMLSAESASGTYPLEAVTMQSKIATTMECELDYGKLALEAYESSQKINSDAIANSVANTALLIDAALIVCFTETGNAVRRISKARPVCPIIAISDSRKTVLELGLVWGAYAFLAPHLPQLIEDMEVLALLKARQLGLAPGSTIILTGGVPTGAGKTNFMKILTLNKLRGETL